MTDPGVILDRCFKVFVDRLERRPGFDLPRYRLTQAGTVAPDCEHFAVSIPPNSIYPGLPGQPRRGFIAETGGVTGWAMDVAVTILRAVPLVDNAGFPPLPDELVKATRTATADANALVDVLNSALNDGSLVDDCALTASNGVTFDGPQGGMLGTILSWSVSL